MALFRDLSENDIFKLDGKEYVFDRWVRGSRGTKCYANIEATGQGWKIQRGFGCEVEILGVKMKVKASDLTRGDLICWKGKKGEMMLFKFDHYGSGNNIHCTNPNDGGEWTLGGGAYAKLQDILDRKVTL